MSIALKLVASNPPAAEAPKAQPHDPKARGYVIQYRTGITCPGCSRSHWHVGRTSAECAFCGTALGLDARAGEAPHG